MSSWLIEIEKEIQILKAQIIPGRIRTSARRISGIALKEFYNSTENNFILLLQKTASDENIPEDVRNSAFRLQSRVDEKFNSICTDPFGDAMRILNFVKTKIKK